MFVQGQRGLQCWDCVHVVEICDLLMPIRITLFQQKEFQCCLVNLLMKFCFSNLYILFHTNQKEKIV